jgi:hypothetical protein
MGEWAYRSTSAVVGGELSASRPGRFIPGEIAPGAHWIGGWVGPRTGLDDVEKRKLLTLPGLELRPLGRPARSQSLYQISVQNPFLTYGVLSSIKIKRGMTLDLLTPVSWNKEQAPHYKDAWGRAAFLTPIQDGGTTIALGGGLQRRPRCSGEQKPLQKAVISRR